MRKLIAICAILLIPNLAHAHRFAPSSLQIYEGDGAQYELLWKTPLQATSNIPLRPAMPEGCSVKQESEPQVEGTGVVKRWSLDCSVFPNGLVGATVSVEGLAQNQASAILMYSYLDQRSWQVVLNAELSAVTIPSAPTAGGVFSSYIVLGAEHIWAGPDHLLFVLGLVLLVVGLRSLLLTVTSFTVGHSITLAMVTLGMFDYPVALVEFLIALSIFVLALEVHAEKPGLFARFPWAVAVGFGLLHGMGFAGALGEVGLPQGQVPLALLSFNIGIELGQIAFILLVLAAGFLVRRYLRVWQDRLEPIAIYTMGGVAAMWCYERGLSVLGF